MSIETEMLYMLSFLEKSAKGLTIKEIEKQLDDTNVSAGSLRTVHRRIKEMTERGFSIIPAGRRYVLACDKGYHLAVVRLLQAISHSKNFSCYFYGDIDTRMVSESLSGLPNVAGILTTILHALQGSREVEFRYKPQTLQTKMKMLSRFKNLDPRNRIIALPHYLAFSQEHSVLLCENFQRNPITGHKTGQARVRQYELKGIGSLKSTTVCARTISIKPEEIYKNSVRVWIGDREHEIVLEETNIPDGTTQARERKINGEEELLSLLLSKVGTLRVVDPPHEIVQLAHAKSVPPHLIFKFTQAPPHE